MSITYIQRPIKNNQAYIKNAQNPDSRYLEFQKRGPIGGVLHSIGTPQPSASVIAEYFDSPFVEASVHMVLQPDGVCYRLAPNNYRLWHAGGSANNTHLAVEMSEPKEISYDAGKGYRVMIHDRGAALSHVRQCYARGVEVFAALCMEYDWDPLKDGVILSHKECYERGMASNHGDPEHLWEALGTGYTMDSFRRAVADEIQRQREAAQGRKYYHTLGELKKSPEAPHYLPTVEKLIGKGYLLGKGKEGDERILDFSEEALRIMVTLDRSGAYDKSP
jgi:N-acetylmuramoyl-L-alanine amidase CwlA